MRSQLPGGRRRKPIRGLLKAQHRMVLGLVSMSAATLMLSLIYQDERADGSSASVPMDATTRTRRRTEIPLPTGRRPAVGEADREGIGKSVRGVRRGVSACLEAFDEGLRPFEGRSTTIEVQLGSAGLARADVLDWKGLPQPFLGCLGATLGTEPWPSGGEEIVLIRVPLTVPERLRAVEAAGSRRSD